MKNARLFALVLWAAAACLPGCGDDATAPVVDDPPAWSILRPETDQAFAFGDTVFFSLSHAEPDHDVAWSSDLDGVLGATAEMFRADLSAGAHVISSVVADGRGHGDSLTVSIEVQAPAEPPPPLKVLFIGASYFSYNQLPNMFRHMVRSDSMDVEIGEAIVNGQFLDYHATDWVTQQKIQQADWDYVILQGICTNAAYPDDHQLIFPPYVRHPLKESIAALKDKILKNCADTKVVYCMAWAFEDGTTWLDGYDDTYLEMQQMVYDNTLAICSDLEVVIAPVGWAWRSVLMEEERLHYLHNTDWNHPATRGSYLMACVLYATLYRQHPSRIQYLSSVPEVEARHFQDVAGDVVLNHPELWGMAPPQ